MDTGIYNSVFKQFQNIDSRMDQGRIIENFVFSELVKFIGQDNIWFYRTNTGSEVDFVINQAGRIELMEVKYSKTRQHLIPKIFTSLIDKLDFKSGHIPTKNYVAVKELHGIPIYFRPVWDIFEFAL